MSQIHNQRSPQILLRLVLGAVMISFSGVWVKVSHVSPTVSAFYRVFIGGIILLCMAAVRGEVHWRYNNRHLLINTGCGVLFATDLILYHYSIQYVGPGLGTILPNFQVFLLAFVGMAFLKETVRPMALFAMPLAFFGLYFIVGIDWRHLGQDYRLGLICGLGAAVCYTGVLLLLRKLQSDQAGASRFSVIMTVSLVTALLIALEVLWTRDSFRIPDIQTLLALIGLGFFSQVLGWLLITNALPHVRASLSGLVLLLQPALAFVWDVLFFKRPTSSLNWMGVVIALVAIYLGATARTAHARKPQNVEKGTAEE
jgi:drug/metabolite transporter (DMT)-like permease